MSAPHVGCSSLLLDLRGHAAVMPDTVALVKPEGARLTFGGLQSRVASVAYQLKAAGIKQNEVVALVFPDSAGLITNLLGIASVAECAVLSPALRRKEFQSLLVVPE